MPTSELLSQVETISGELGGRIVCQVLAGANDVDRDLKIAHIEGRLLAQTATGDDRDLINDILTTPLSREELERWRAVFGEPSSATDADVPDGIGDNWPRGWRWSVVLPREVLRGWEEAIAAVTDRHGEPSTSVLHIRSPRFWYERGRSPYSSNELSALSVHEAASLVALWRPSEEDGWGVSARELARALETTVKENPRDWTEDPSTIVATLREPVYISHYFQAITATVSELTDRAQDVLAALQLIGDERREPTPLGRDDGYEYDLDWSAVDTATVQVIAAFANANADIAAGLDMSWDLATEQVHRLPDVLPELEDHEDTSVSDDPLNRAINRSYGKALEAVLALGGWEHRNQGGASERLGTILDEVVALPGAVGLELRSIAVRRRHFLEAVAPEWLDARTADLFGSNPLGTATFDQTVKWSRPTRWFYSQYQPELLSAARRGTDNAIAWLLIAYLWDEPGYTIANIIRAFAGDIPALKTVGGTVASLARDVEADDDPKLDRAVKLWEALLNEDRQLVPAKALGGLGRWVFVRTLNAQRWLHLMDRTVALATGDIEMAIEIADRCKEAQPSTDGLQILRMLIGGGEPWEQHHIETTAIEALRAAASHPVGEEFDRLRTRLIQRGRHEATDINPERPPPG